MGSTKNKPSRVCISPLSIRSDKRLAGGPVTPFSGKRCDFMLSANNNKPLLVTNIGSPYMLALLSYAVFLFAWMFPGPVYTTFVHEPDLLWFDPIAFAYFSACVTVF